MSASVSMSWAMSSSHFFVGEGSRSRSSLREVHSVEASPFNKTCGEKDSGKGIFGSSFD
jgi:hypothetical protein